MSYFAWLLWFLLRKGNKKEKEMWDYMACACAFVEVEGLWCGLVWGHCPTLCCGVVRGLVPVGYSILSARVISHAATVYLAPRAAVTVCIWMGGGCVAWRALGRRPSQARAVHHVSSITHR